MALESHPPLRGIFANVEPLLSGAYLGGIQEMSPEPFLAGEVTTAEEVPSSSSPHENVSATPPTSAGALKGIAPAIRCET